MRPRTFYPTSLVDRFGNKVLFEYEDNVDGFGRKNLTKIIMDFVAASDEDDYVISINYLREVPLYVTGITLSDGQQDVMLEGLTPSEYPSAKDKFLVDRISLTDAASSFSSTEVFYDFRSHKMIFSEVFRPYLKRSLN